MEPEARRTLRPAAQAGVGKIDILIVDDQPANLFALESLLDHSDYSIVKAFSGPEALRCMLKQEFALVLLDVLMPGMDGFETAGLIRQRQQSKYTPIIFITASNSNETHVTRGYSLGAVDYIYKPIVSEILKAKVQVFVELYRKNRLLARSEEALRRELAEHKRLEEARRDSEARYREVFTRASDAIIVFDQEGRVADVNRAALALYGYSRREFLKLVRGDLFPASETAVPEKPSAVEPAGAPRPVLRFQKRRDGSVFPAEKTYGSFLFRGERLTVALCRDVSERLKAQEAEKFREREIIQRQLVATVSHELRTPIAAIKASAETMRMGGVSDPKSQPRFIKIIESQADRLSWLVEDLLSVAELEAGKAQPEPRAMPLKTFAEEFVKEIGPLASRRGISIEVAMRGELEIWIDQAHLARVFQNLLDNAIKYNKPGGSVVIEGRRLDDRTAQVSIRDTGIGIPSGDLPLIFQQFHRTEGARAHAVKGTGLGLYIIKTIVESNGGRIWAESERAKGSTFHFTAPLARRAGN